MKRSHLLSKALSKSGYAIPILILTVISGCNQSLELKVESEVPTPLVSKIPMSMGVFYGDNFKNYVYTEDSTDRPNWAIESGPSQVALFNQILPSMFRDVREVNSLAVSEAGDQVNAILVPSIEEMQFSLPRETRLDMYEVWIKYNIRLLETNGDLISEWPITAYGKTETEFMKNREKGLNGAMELALRDAGAKLAIGFPEVMEVKQWLASHIAECTGQADNVC